MNRFLPFIFIFPLLARATGPVVLPVKEVDGELVARVVPMADAVPEVRAAERKSLEARGIPVDVSAKGAYVTGQEALVAPASFQHMEGGLVAAAVTPKKTIECDARTDGRLNIRINEINLLRAIGVVAGTAKKQVVVASLPEVNISGQWVGVTLDEWLSQLAINHSFSFKVFPLGQDSLGQGSRQWPAFLQVTEEQLAGMHRPVNEQEAHSLTNFPGASFGLMRGDKIPDGSRERPFIYKFGADDFIKNSPTELILIQR
jgi:hypothetical protein